jgi:hypothetical protein
VRLRLARLIVDDGWPVARAAERYDAVRSSIPDRSRSRVIEVVMGVLP